MSKLSFETTLDRCVNLLLSGRSISDCIKMYPRVRGLKQALLVAQRAINLPKKKLEFDKNKVWQTIQTKIREEKENVSDSNAVLKHANPSPIGGFRLAFSRSVFSLVTIMVIVGLVNATTVAAKNSLPGQTLYPVKKTVERVELVLTINDEKKTEKKIKNAGTRLYEAHQIVEQNSYGDSGELDEKQSKAVGETITALVNTTEEIANESEGNKGLLEKVVVLADKQEEILTAIETKTTGDTKGVVEAAKKSASEKKVAAVENLAELEKQESEKNMEVTSTTTDENIEGEVKGETDEDTATTTDDKLEILGDPNASSTMEIIIPISSNNTNTSSTPEIIDLK